MKFLTRTLVLYSLWLTAAAASSEQTTGSSNLVKTFELVATRFQADAPRHRIYATIMGSNSVAVIDTDTLTVTKNIPIGSAPAGMSISPDRTKLYVALSGATDRERRRWHHRGRLGGNLQSALVQVFGLEEGGAPHQPTVSSADKV